MKKSLFGRSIELTKMAAKIGFHELRSGDLKSRLEQARVITESLAQLKGAAMKAGQLLSMEVGDYFPKEATEILSQLQNAATTVPFNDIKRRLTLELGAAQLSRLEDLSIEPVASASIAQVHSARLDGRRVAVKVQHDGVAESIDSDLTLLKNVAKSLCRLSGRKMDLDPLFEEFREILRQEVDFTREAELLANYRGHLSSLSRPGSLYSAPEAIAEFSTEKVLTMTWEEGETLTSWLTSARSRGAREQVAHLIVQLYCHEFFEWGLVQTDPNFSNFLIREERDEPALVVLDFGATKRFESSLIAAYVSLLRAVASGRERSVVERAIEFNLLDPRESPETQTSFVEMMKVSVEPFVGRESNKLFDFGDRDYSRRCREAVTRFTGLVKFSPPPHQIIFLHRKLGGIFFLLQRLEVETSLAPYWEKILSSKLDHF